MKICESKAINAQREWLEAFNLHDDPEVQGTPARVTAFWTQKLLKGYQLDPKLELGRPLETETHTLVCLKGIPFHSVCPHHLVPYFGTVDIAYDPSRHIVGFGHFERFVAACSRRLRLQEPLTEEIAEGVRDHLDARGVICRIQAQHLCFMLDGREPRDTQIITWHAIGTLEGQYTLLNQGDSSRTV